MTRRVLVVGGTGAFGRRLVASLMATTDATTIIAARSLNACEALAAELGARRPAARIETAILDRRTADAKAIAALDPFCVVDAAGPFQGDNLGFARAVIAAGRHYVDLADARDFVAQFPELDAQARAAGVVAIAGASSTPALSHAALDALTAGWTSVDRVEIAIAPGNRAPRGLAVMQAILSYAGRPVRVLRDGAWGEAPGWGLLVRRRIPGLGPRWLSLCETPDLDLVSVRRPEVRTVLFRAGLELSALHLGLWAASWLVRLRAVANLAPYAAPFRRLADLFERFGTDRGGMTVKAEGRDADGAPARADWTLVADAGDGPEIPTLPAVAFVRGLLDDRPPAPSGAHAAAGLLTLEAFSVEAERFRIAARVARAAPGADTLFDKALGPDVGRLPHIVRTVHAPRPAATLTGTVEIDGAERPLGRLVARMFGFPPATPETDALVTIERTPEGETWTRCFGGAAFASRLSWPGAPGVLEERFGPFAFQLLATAGADGFRFAVDGWSVLGVPLPRRLAPSTDARGFARPDGGYGFDVTIAYPGLGRLTRYRGRLSMSQPA